ncbi:ABC transporter permease [Brachyspira aalborgi]|uniref:ABC transporter permease n=1 Tax=Brachyspira aalborgi TaxID=29522 RepID=A0A5C8DWP8_9SPIR|nr:ABC transporter permease [Brachyspira aalborgi]TXJ13197.1 ABC transporter permease [Brachyspira aalborgi]TXJ29586.1 ABC transporter permease [Brachyspira aalborgi]TXJ35344.1 ABC transporter permease [Brachyspira aalborgi]TXJ61491.1 ABC transporter permease [Brachyspira aalborgi]
MNKKTLTHFSIRYGFLIIMVLLFIFFSITRPVFLTPSNLLSILLGLTIYAILALGETFPLIVNGMDLSIGAIASLSVMVSSYCMVILELKGYYAIIICLLMGATIGLINGLLIVKLKIPDLLTTLGMMFLVQGLQLIPSAGRSIGNGMSLPNGETAKGVFDEGFKFLGQGRLFDIIPIPVAFMFIIAVIVFIVLSLTRYGRIFYAIGGNSEAARLVGVNIYKYRILAYIISGFVASFAGIVLAARVGRGDVSSGGTLLMDAIASALIGYAVLGAQKPNPFGTIVGAIFIGMLINGLTMLNVPYYTQDFIKGCVLVTALAFTFGLSKRKS